MRSSSLLLYAWPERIQVSILSASVNSIATFSILSRNASCSILSHVRYLQGHCFCSVKFLFSPAFILFGLLNLLDVRNHRTDAERLSSKSRPFIVTVKHSAWCRQLPCSFFPSRLHLVNLSIQYWKFVFERTNSNLQLISASECLECFRTVYLSQWKWKIFAALHNANVEDWSTKCPY